MESRGQQTYESRAGQTSQNHQSSMELPTRARQKSTWTCLDFKSLLCSLILIFTFASINKKFTVATHNLHGFKNTSIFHKQCIQKYSGIWFAQELWLPESRLSQLQDLGVHFVGRSGMENALSNGIMRGRPHGGVSIAWSPDFNHVIKPLVNYRHKRVVAVEAIT